MRDYISSLFGTGINFKGSSTTNINELKKRSDLQPTQNGMMAETDEEVFMTHPAFLNPSSPFFQNGETIGQKMSINSAARNAYG